MRLFLPAVAGLFAIVSMSGPACAQAREVDRSTGLTTWQQIQSERADTLRLGLFYRWSGPSHDNPAGLVESGIGLNLTRHHTAGDLHPISLEMRFDDPHERGFWLKGSQSVSFRSIRDAASAARAQGELGRGGQSSALLVGGLVVGALLLVTLTQDSDGPEQCSGNTVPNPLSGKCEPLQL
jgi:hypothetical protein